MNNSSENFVADRDKMPLPKIARTRSGVEFMPDEAHWLFRDGTVQVSINFNLLPVVCYPLLFGLKKTLLWFLENKSPGTASSYFTSFVCFARWLDDGSRGGVDCIYPEDVLAIKMEPYSVQYNFTKVRPLLKKWFDLGVAGVGQDVIYVLNHLSINQAPLGVAVATLDPKKGPLTDLEFEAIQIALNQAYAQGKSKAEHLLLCYLLMSLGARPAQLASLKCGDLIIPDSQDGDYILKVPRAKQQAQLARATFKFRKLTRQIGDPLAAHVALLQVEFAEQFKNIGEVPLFPQRKYVENSNSPGFEHHLTAAVLSQTVSNLFDRLNVYSERLEGYIPIFSYRFRRTFATRAAEEGWPMLVLAELMDHTNTKHVMVYAGLTSRIRAQFSRKIAMEMAPLAMAFNGKVIRNEDDATRPGEVSRIIDLRIDRAGASMGSCGSHVHCGFARPVACYAGCYEFEPWLDGPHEAALDYMLARREYLISTTDIRMASINDRAILGCAQVILRCRQILAEFKHD